MALKIVGGDFLGGYYTQAMVRLYEQVSGLPLPAKVYGLPIDMIQLLEVVWSMEGLPGPHMEDCMPRELATPDRPWGGQKGVPLYVAFSGGKDSAAVLVEARRQGYDVTAVHISGLNKGQSKPEREQAVAIAEALSIPLLVFEVKIKGKREYADNLVKNQLALAIALQYGLEYGVWHYSLGNMTTDTHYTVQPHYNGTDMLEHLNAWAWWVRDSYPEIRMPYFLRHITDSMRILAQQAPQVLPLTRSCFALAWQRSIWRPKNQSKYGLRLMPSRCGSCWKCCTEFVCLDDLGYLDEEHGAGNVEFRQHCIDYLRRVAPREKPHVSAPKSLTDQQVVGLYIDEGIVNEGRAAQGLPPISYGEPAPEAAQVAALVAPLAAQAWEHGLPMPGD